MRGAPYISNVSGSSSDALFEIVQHTGHWSQSEERLARVKDVFIRCRRNFRSSSRVRLCLISCWCVDAKLKADGYSTTQVLVGKSSIGQLHIAGATAITQARSKIFRLIKTTSTFLNFEAEMHWWVWNLRMHRLGHSKAGANTIRWRNRL